MTRISCLRTCHLCQARGRLSPYRARIDLKAGPMLPPTTASVLREVALLTGRAAERADANDFELTLDLACRALEWLPLAIRDLRRAHQRGDA